MNPPKKIKIKSDGNVLEYSDTINPTKKEPIYVYKYVQSKEKLNTFLGLNANDLNKLIEQNKF